MRKINIKKVGVVGLVLAAVVAAFIALAGGPAQAKALLTGEDIKDQSVYSVDIASQGVGTSEIRNQSVISGDIAEGGVGASEVRNGSLTGTDLAPATVERFLKDEVGMSEDDADAKYATKADEDAREDESGIDPVFSSGAEKDVAEMGGSWGTFAAPRATEIDSLTLTPGEYMINAEGIMATLGSDADGFFGQIAVRSADGTPWGADLGTCFTADFGTQANRETSCSTTRVVEFTEQTQVKVFAFGYQRDGQGGVSNAVKAKSFLTATPVID